MSRKVSVSDVTIKLTEMNPQSALSFRRKIELTKILDKLGVSVIETSPIVNGKSDSLLVKSLSSAIQSATLAVPVDCTNPESIGQSWEALKDAVKPRLQVSVPVSTVQMEYLCHKKSAAVLEMVSDLVSRCAALCPEVEFVAEDFGRSEQEFLLQTINEAIKSGASVVTVRDLAGNLIYDDFYSRISEIRRQIPQNVRLGVWCSNEMFMADACAIAAVKAGADEIKTMPYGRETTSLKRFAAILNAKCDELGTACHINSTAILRLSEEIKRLCYSDRSKALSSAAISHEDTSDIRLTIQDTEDVVRKAAQRLGYDLSDDDMTKVYETFVRLASKNEIVEAKELDAIIASVAFQAPPTFKLESYVINTGNLISATCHIRLIRDNTRLESVCVGDGPVDAAFKAIEKLVDKHYEVDDFQVQAVTEGREAMGEAVVRLRYEGKLFSGRGISTDITGSSIMAYLNAVNKIEFEEE